MNIWQERILEALEASNMFDTTKLRELQVQDKTGKQFMDMSFDRRAFQYGKY